jgi:hypothetical protein
MKVSTDHIIYALISLHLSSKPVPYYSLRRQHFLIVMASRKRKTDGAQEGKPSKKKKYMHPKVEAEEVAEKVSRFPSSCRKLCLLVYPCSHLHYSALTY